MFKKQLFIVFILTVFFSHAMEQQKLQIPKTTVIIRGIDEKVISVPEKIAMQSTMIHDYLVQFSHEDVLEGKYRESVNEEKSVDFTLGSVDFLSQPYTSPNK